MEDEIYKKWENWIKKILGIWFKKIGTEEKAG